MTRSDQLKITVRHASAADNILLAEIGAETFSDAFAQYNTPEDMRLYLESSFSPEIQARELADRLSIFLIAEVAGEAVGYARLHEGAKPSESLGSRPVEIVRFYARSPWIGRRVGAALMETCLKEASIRGCDVIWLGVWEKNQRAIAFYEKWGFQGVGAQEFHLGKDIQRDLLMVRSVSPAGVV